MTEEIDPVKRTIVRIPRVTKPRGRLRWIGDAIANTVIKSLYIFQVISQCYNWLWNCKLSIN